jgi:hypothetical protein
VQEPQPQDGRQQPHRARHPREHGEKPEHRREKALKAVRRGEHDLRDPLGMAHHQNLRQRAPGVVRDHGHVTEIERVEKIGDQLRLARRREVGVHGHRPLMRTQRPIRCETTETGFGYPG